MLSLAVAYAVLGRLGMAIALQQVTAVWPPSGLALFALLLWGSRVAPGVFLGSFALNLWYLARPGAGTTSIAVAVAVAVAAAMAAGATVEALLAARLLGEARGVALLDRAAHVFRLAFAALVAAAVPATAGTASLVAGGFVPASSAVWTWWTWFLGDAVGILTVTPFLLTFARRSEQPIATAPRRAEALLLVILIGATGALAFFGRYPLEYLLLPALVWAVFRFGARGATFGTLLASAIATWGTCLGRGPFAHGSLTTSLLLLHAFLGVLAMTALLLAAVLSEMRQRDAELTAATAEAREARAAAEEANQAKAIFLANMGHELRTPLNHVIGYADMLEEEVGEAGAPQLAPDVRKVGRAARQLLGILHRILELAQLGARRLELETSTFPLARAVEAAAGRARPLAEANGNTLSVTLPENAGSISTDEARLGEVLDALLQNACTFTSRGSVSLRASREARDGVDGYLLAVADTGIGMSEAEMEGLFQPFTQVDSGPARRFGGAGLGLALTKRLCQLMGGEVSVTSRPGQGSTFTVWLPVEPATARSDTRSGLDRRRGERRNGHAEEGPLTARGR